MIHLGDITKICGYEAPPVDCIIGGSPCQDLSVAGKRAGLEGERSGLFMEQIRITKEMRDGLRTDNPFQGRWLVWENVPGAFSSNGGEDFRAVLEEVVRIKDPEISVPRPPRDKWQPAGAIVGDGYSVAWRVHDAQYWGVPQRRKRICIVADFGGGTAPQILLEPEGMCGYTPQSERKRQDASAVAGRNADRAGWAQAVDCYNQTVTGDKSKSLTNKATDSDHIPVVAYGLDRASYNQGKNAKYDFSVEKEKIGAQVAKGPGAVCTAVSVNGKDYAATIDSHYYLGCGARGGVEREAVAQELPSGATVRRLTPLECERLQGFPDGWTDIGEWVDSKGKRHKEADAPRYKALGNSIALPFWRWLVRRIQGCGACTMASLFDGIGGFPLVWEESAGKGTAVWASEIEEFPIAVTKKHFPEEET